MTLSATVKRSALVEALRIVGAAAKPTLNGQIPTHHVLIEAKGEALKFRTTDLELTIVTSCGAKITSEGDATVEHKRIAGLVKSLNCEEVQLEVLANKRLRVVGGGSDYELESLLAETFPSPPDLDDAHGSLEIGAKDFVTAMKNGAFPIGEVEKGWTLSGAWMRSNGTGTIIESLDGHRLFRQRVHSRGSIGLPAAIVPVVAVRAVQSVESLDDDVVKLSWDDRMFRAEFQAVTMMARLPDASSMPNTDEMIQQYSVDLSWVTTSRSDLYAAFARTMTIGDSGGKAPRIANVDFEQGRIVISRHDEISSGREEIPADSAVSVKCALSAIYVSEFLSVLDADRVAIGMVADGNGAFFMRDAAALGDDSPDVEYLVMPVRRG